MGRTNRLIAKANWGDKEKEYTLESSCSAFTNKQTDKSEKIDEQYKQVSTDTDGCEPLFTALVENIYQTTTRGHNKSGWA